MALRPGKVDPPKPRGICANCIYYDGIHGRHDDDGECHRHAPVPLVVKDDLDDDDTYISVWPLVRDIDSCGDFSKRADA